MPTESLDKSLLEFNNLLSPANLRVKRLPLTPGNGSPLRFSHWIVFLTRFRFPRIQETSLYEVPTEQASDYMSSNGIDAAFAGTELPFTAVGWIQLLTAAKDSSR